MSDGNPPPLIFSEDFLNQSLDVFPIEFLDIKSAHRMLYGPDPFESLSVQTADLHHQLEFELRSKLVQMQQRFLQSGGEAKALRELLGRSLSAYTALFGRHSGSWMKKFQNRGARFGSLWKNIFPLMWRRSITFCCFEREPNIPR